MLIVIVSQVDRTGGFGRSGLGSSALGSNRRRVAPSHGRQGFYNSHHKKCTENTMFISHLTSLVHYKTGN